MICDERKEWLEVGFRSPDDPMTRYFTAFATAGYDERQ
jgi:hypothetical protein